MNYITKKFFHFPSLRSFLVQNTQNSSAALYANLLERISFFLPQCPSSPTSLPARSAWRMQGKLYRSKVESSQSTVMTLNTANQESLFKTATGIVLHADSDLESILGKLTLMYAARQSYFIEGTAWGELVRIGSVNFGGEVGGVIIEFGNDVVWAELNELALKDLMLEQLIGDDESKYFNLLSVK